MNIKDNKKYGVQSFLSKRNRVINQEFIS